MVHRALPHSNKNQIFQINEKDFLNILTTECQKPIWLKEATKKSTITVGGFDPLPIIDRISRQKISKDVDDLDSAIKQSDQIDNF